MKTIFTTASTLFVCIAAVFLPADASANPPCMNNYTINLATPGNWVTGANAPAVTVNSATVTLNGWGTNRTWMSYAADAEEDSTTPPNGPYYTFTLKFCSCHPILGGNGLGHVGGNILTAGGAVGKLKPTPGWAPLIIFSTSSSPPSAPPAGTGNAAGVYQGNGVPKPINQTFPGAGNGTITITVFDYDGPMAISPVGNLTLKRGHPGPCP